MFDATFQLLSTHPVTLPAFLLALWVCYRLLRRSWSVVAALGKLTAGLAVVPLFTTLFLAEFTGHWVWERLAAAVLAALSSAGALFVDLVDSLLAAWLTLVLVVSSDLWNTLEGAVASATPTLSGVGFVIAVFVFQFVAGAASIYAVYRASHEGTANGWLLGGGVVLFVSGLFAALIGLERWQLTPSVLASGLVAATLGLTLGILSVVVLVRPDFGGESVLPELRARLVPPERTETDEVHR